MAQKTPLPALTINYADRWHGTWFSDLSYFSQKFLEDLRLRLLILSFFRFKNYSLLRLNINNSGGYYFFQYTVIPTFTINNLNLITYPANKPFYLKHPSTEQQKKEHSLLDIKSNYSNLLIYKLFNYWNLISNNIKILSLCKNKYSTQNITITNRKKWIKISNKYGVHFDNYHVLYNFNKFQISPLEKKDIKYNRQPFLTVIEKYTPTNSLLLTNLIFFNIINRFNLLQSLFKPAILKIKLKLSKNNTSLSFIQNLPYLLILPKEFNNILLKFNMQKLIFFKTFKAIPVSNNKLTIKKLLCHRYFSTQSLNYPLYNKNKTCLFAKTQDLLMFNLIVSNNNILLRLKKFTALYLLVLNFLTDVNFNLYFNKLSKLTKNLYLFNTLKMCNNIVLFYFAQTQLNSHSIRYLQKFLLLLTKIKMYNIINVFYFNINTFLINYLITCFTDSLTLLHSNNYSPTNHCIKSLILEGKKNQKTIKNWTWCVLQINEHYNLHHSNWLIELEVETLPSTEVHSSLSSYEPLVIILFYKKLLHDYRKIFKLYIFNNLKFRLNIYKLLNSLQDYNITASPLTFCLFMTKLKFMLLILNNMYVLYNHSSYWRHYAFDYPNTMIKHYTFIFQKLQDKLNIIKNFKFNLKQKNFVSYVSNIINFNSKDAIKNSTQKRFFTHSANNFIKTKFLMKLPTPTPNKENTPLPKKKKKLQKTLYGRNIKKNIWYKLCKLYQNFKPWKKKNWFIHKLTYFLILRLVLFNYIFKWKRKSTWLYYQNINQWLNWKNNKKTFKFLNVKNKKNYKKSIIINSVRTLGLKKNIQYIPLSLPWYLIYNEDKQVTTVTKNLNYNYIRQIVKKNTIATTKTNYNLLGTQFKALNFFYRNLPHADLATKKHKALFSAIHQLNSKIWKKTFKFKKFKSYQKGLASYYKKKLGNNFYRLRGLKIILSPLVILMQSIKQVTKVLNIHSFVILDWKANMYKPLQNFVVFEKFRGKKFFTSTMVALHEAMSKGSAIIFTDILCRKLQTLHKHTTFLACVKQITHYFIAPPESNIAYNDSICKGIEILFKGKVNGVDRAKIWRFKLGPLNTSTFTTTTVEEHAKCVTKYGVFNIRVRLKLGLMWKRYY